MKVSLVSLVAGLVAVSFAGNAQASIDIVQSVPLETNLALSNVQDTASAWLELINSAKQSIDLEEFYMSGGDSLTPIVDAIKVQAQKGVKVRMILDAGFYKTYPDVANSLAQLPGAQLKTIDFSKNGGIMHAKYFVIDSQRAYAGSANFDWLALSHIHEVGAKIDDAQIAAGLESVFNLDWGSAVVPKVSSIFGFTAHDPVASFLNLYASPGNDLPGDVPQTLSALLKLINSAKTSLKIQMYEYATTLYGSSERFMDLDNALRAAAKRGVKVQFRVDQTAMKAGKKDLQALAKIPNLEVKVITIPQWSGGHLDYARVAHSKYLIADDQTVWVGSENWSGDYFSSSRNVGMMTNDPGSLAKILEIFNAVSNSGYLSAP